VPSNVPERNRRVYMVGAGVSSAFRIPNTPSLLESLASFSKTANGSWLADVGIENSLDRAFKFFYPDAANDGFRPDAVDFFSALRTYIDVSKGWAGTGFDDASELYRILKRGIAHNLLQQAKSIPEDQFMANEFFNEMVRPGQIIITSNWDTLIERFAALNEIPLRLTSSSRKFNENEVSLLKLHGSLDWCQVSARAPGHGDREYANLTELENAPRTYTLTLPQEAEALVRVRSGPGDTWQKVRAKSPNPWMVTMVTGKQDDLGPLQPIWRDAYRALSHARTLTIAGYSMPPDDVEVRTLLRAGLKRGTSKPHVVVKNPAPDVHYRVRAYLARHAASDFMPVAL
jgi:hypothetical protein